MAKLLFSIVIPSYNYAETLSRAIESALSQGGEDFELLIINDGSTDNTGEVAKALLVKTDNAFRYIEKKNSGPAATRNVGVAKSRGQFLIFLDADDEMVPGALKHYRDQITRNPEAKMIAGGHTSRDECGREKEHCTNALPRSAHEKLKAYLLDKTLSFSNGAVAISREVFDGYRYPEKFRSSEDIPMFAYILANFEVAIIDSSLAIIHKHSDSLRHNIEHAKEVGLEVVDEVFNAERMPLALLSLKKPFIAQRSLSLFRTLYAARRYDEARQYYHHAIAIRPSALFRFSYFLKYLKSWFSGKKET